MISRMKDAPVAAARATEDIASHNTLTPKGRVIWLRTWPMMNAIVAVEAVST